MVQLDQLDEGMSWVRKLRRRVEGGRECVLWRSDH